MEESIQPHWVDKLARISLPACLVSDVACALVSGFAVAPFCTIVDRSVIQNANGAVPLWQGVKNGFKTLLTKPTTFMKSLEFKLLFMVYGATYIAANTSESICVNQHIDPVIPKLLTTFVVNTAVGIYKDKRLTQHFGTVKPTNFPINSYLLFWTRDIITIAFAFTFPKILGKKLADTGKVKEKDAIKMFQIMCPLMIQFVATPLHLLGLDLYNNPQRTMGQRGTFLRSVIAETLVVRMARFLPAYGLAGVLNIVMRDNLDAALRKMIA